MAQFWEKILAFFNGQPITGEHPISNSHLVYLTITLITKTDDHNVTITITLIIDNDNVDNDNVDNDNVDNR